MIQQGKWKMTALAAGVLALSVSLQAQIADGPVWPSVRILATDPTALSGTSSGAFTVLRAVAGTNDLTLNLTITGTASNGVDYVAIPDTLTIPAGTLAVDIPVTPIFNAARRGNKTVVISLGTNALPVAVSPMAARVLIVDDVFNIPPPTVAISSPTNGSVFDDVSSITVTADASDPDSPIASVSFFANDKFLGKTTTSPYSLVWSNPPAGRFTLFARAVNQVGESALSAPVMIKVTHPLPTVSITSPTNGQNFAAHSDVAIAADASDTDDSIAKVTFFANGRWLGESTNAPYSLVWSNSPAGIFALTAVATDAAGDRGYSKPVMINVSRPPIGKMSVVRTSSSASSAGSSLSN